ncbi:MAG: hypothetical protein NC043_08965 [Muribaculaceae bacterium]|nr:hypothetical protein [Muribaculaceae bacterium]
MTIRCIVFSLAVTLSSVFVCAGNRISRTAEVAENIADTLAFNHYLCSNSSGVITVYASIVSKNKPFEVYGIELTLNDSIYHPIEPFAMSADSTQVADSLVTWEVYVEFPYSAQFFRSDSTILYTSEGTFKTPILPGSPDSSHSSEPERHVPFAVIAAGLTIIIAGVSVLIVLFMYRRAKRRHSEEIMRYDELLDSSRRHSEALSEKIEALYSNRLDIFNRLCDEYFNKKDVESENVRLSLYREVESQIADLRSSKSLSELESMVDTYLDSLLSKAKAQMPWLSKSDITFLTYLYAGFSPRAVCLFTDIKIKNFYNRRSRLKERILASDAPDKEMFASKM